mmetsp:Transcript_73147/g.206874  ORF Transcript_73147/g.206874 Transcript_73147/m.206874 type:complete len:203 (-) Transcript_73147:99-707(-)
MAEGVRDMETTGEAQRLVPQVPPSVWQGILHFTQYRRRVPAVWALECVWMLFIVMANSLELWGSCAYEKGWAPMCRYCFTEIFLAWSAVLVWFWIQHLFLSILLVSRGFSAKISDVGSMSTMAKANKGIPVVAMYFFLILSAVMLFWVALGVLVLGLSCACPDGRTFERTSTTNPRSGLMVATTVVSVVITPVLLYVGRLET